MVSQWDKEDIDILISEYPTKGSNIIELLEKGFKNRAIRRKAFKLGLKYKYRVGTLQAQQKIAEKRGGKCLSKEYINATTKLDYECANGHRFKTKPSDITYGRWCPYCLNNLGERITRKYFEMIFNNEFPKVRPKWLINPKTNKLLELDGYCKELSIAFEYNGGQHYIPTNYPNHNVNEVKERDKIKNKSCLENNVKLITIPYTIKHENIQEFIIKECGRISIDIPRKIEYIDYKKLDIYDNIELNRFKAISKDKGGECLSKAYLGCDTELEFRCKRNHVFWISPRSITRGHWCFKCGYIDRKPTLTHSISDVKLIGLEHGLDFLSEDFKNRNTKYDWKCLDCGEIINRTLNSIMCDENERMHCRNRERKRKRILEVNKMRKFKERK